MTLPVWLCQEFSLFCGHSPFSLTAVFGSGTISSCFRFSVLFYSNSSSNTSVIAYAFYITMYVHTYVCMCAHTIEISNFRVKMGFSCEAPIKWKWYMTTTSHMTLHAAQRSTASLLAMHVCIRYSCSNGHMWHMSVHTYVRM